MSLLIYRSHMMNSYTMLVLLELELKLLITKCYSYQEIQCDDNEDLTLNTILLRRICPPLSRHGIGFSRFPRQMCSELNKVGLPNT